MSAAPAAVLVETQRRLFGMAFGTDGYMDEVSGVLISTALGFIGTILLGRQLPGGLQKEPAPLPQPCDCTRNGIQNPRWLQGTAFRKSGSSLTVTRTILLTQDIGR